MTAEELNKVLVKIAKGTPLEEISEIYSISTSILEEWKILYQGTIENIKASLQVREFIRENKLEEALAICTLERFSDVEVIQSQRAVILNKLERPKEALNICNNPRFKSNPYFQIILYSILYNDMLRKYPLLEFDKVLAICDDPLFQKNASIQSQKITILIKQKKYDKALIICNKPFFRKNAIIQSQKVTILIIRRQYDEALVICNNSLFAENGQIQSQKITILIRQKRYNEALVICNNPLFQKDGSIQSQKVTILIKQEKYEEALVICNNPLFAEYDSIQSQKVTILRKQKKYDEALVICNNPLFAESVIIQIQKKNILDKNPDLKDTLLAEDVEQMMTDEISGSIAFSLLNNIKNRSISLVTIHESSVSSLEKIILTVSFYEMEEYSPKMILNYIKSQINECKDNQEALQILNQLKIRMLQRGRFFDIVFYQKLLLCNINIQEELLSVRNNLENLRDDNLESDPKR